MSSLYYLGVGVCSLAISIYNFNINNSNLQCFNNQTMTLAQFEEYKKTVTNPVTYPLGDDCNVEVSTTNVYGILALILAILFIIMFAMSIFLSCVINSMSNQLPEDFININAVKKFLACFCKILPPIFILLSWVNFILIIVIWILYVTNHCSGVVSNSPSKFLAKDSYRNDVMILNIVNSVIWIVLHYGGAVVRDMTYQEPFMYSPDTGTPNCCRTLMLKKLGP